MTANTMTKTITSIAKRLTLDDLSTPFTPHYVKKKAEEELNSKDFHEEKVGPNSYILRAATLKEFDNGVLLAECFGDEYKTFLIELSNQIQQEYDCKTYSQKASAELAANAYGRTLHIQRMINKYLALGSITDMGVRYLTVLSKELDRANRHYLAAIQMLISLKQPAMNITVKTQNANIAQQQVIQENLHVTPK